MKFRCRDFEGIRPIFERMDVLGFESVVGASKLSPGEVVFCQPVDEGPYYICIIREMTDSETTDERDGIPSSDKSAASASRAGEESTTSNPRDKTVWRIYTGTDRYVGRCKRTRIFGRLTGVKQDGFNIWRPVPHMG